MSATATLVAPRLAPESTLPTVAFDLNGNPGHWPRDLIEAYQRYRGPYTVENAETFLEEEPVELYNGWLVWQEMTNYVERRVVATLQTMLDVSARKAGYGQTLSDQLECLLADGTVVKPDLSLVSWERGRNDLVYTGPHQRPLLNGGPDLAVEVRSPSNRRTQERKKRTLYFANKVKIVWDVDEEAQVIWVHRAETPNKSTRHGMGDEIGCEPLLPGWRRRVADIFDPEASAETVLGEAVETWRAEGKVEGVTEGMIKALCDTLPMLVRAQFRVEPPSDLPARLAQYDLAQLQALQAAVITSPSLEAWLTLLPPLHQPK